MTVVGCVCGFACHMSTHSVKATITDTVLCQVLETCVKNCGLRFHVKIAQKEFLNDLLRVIQPKVRPELLLSTASDMGLCAEQPTHHCQGESAWPHSVLGRCLQRPAAAGHGGRGL